MKRLKRITTSSNNLSIDTMKKGISALDALGFKNVVDDLWIATYDDEAYVYRADEDDLMCYSGIDNFVEWLEAYTGEYPNDYMSEHYIDSEVVSFDEILF